MKMERIFHSVGQGALYTEEFEGFSIVYDCGSETSIDHVENAIRNTFIKNHRIDALFISHFHSDHINGLAFLLSHCKVQIIFLPLLNRDEKIQLLIHNAVTSASDSLATRIIKAPEKTIGEISKETKIIFVKQKESGDNSATDIRHQIDELKNKDEIKSGVLLETTNIPQWCFIPCNFQFSKRSQLLKQALHRNGILLPDASAFRCAWRNPAKKAKIIQAYKSLPGNFNTNSMTLYSGPNKSSSANGFMKMSIACRKDGFFENCFRDIKSGCLYFGDYEAKGSKKWTELWSKYKNYWGNIGVVQIPHHGSRHNYNPEINRKQPVVSIMSCGSTNSYGHPHSSTVGEIYKKGCLPIIVTERSNSEVRFSIF